MELRPLGATTVSVSRLGLGTAGFSALESAGRSEPDRLLDRYLAAGGNLVDTADSYDGGRCEEVLGRLLRGSRRDDVVLCTKVGWPSAAGPGGLGKHHVARSIDESLRRLRTDRIDLYQLHLYDARTPYEETLEALEDAVRKGKIRHVGASAFFAWQLARANGIAAVRDAPRLESVQLSYNLAQRDAERDHLGYCAADEVSIIVYSPLHGGTLAGALSGARTDVSAARLADPLLREIYLGRREQHVRSVARAVDTAAQRCAATPAQVGLAWLFEQPVTTVLVGPDSVTELEEDLAALELTLPDDVRRELQSVSELDPGYPAAFYERAGRMAARLSSADPAPERLDSR